VGSHKDVSFFSSDSEEEAEPAALLPTLVASKASVGSAASPPPDAVDRRVVGTRRQQPLESRVLACYEEDEEEDEEDDEDGKGLANNTPTREELKLSKAEARSRRRKVLRAKSVISSLFCIFGTLSRAKSLVYSAVLFVCTFGQRMGSMGTHS
jgi:hypothetical protein